MSKSCEILIENFLYLLRLEFSPLEGATRGGYHRSTDISRLVIESGEEDSCLDRDRYQSQKNSERDRCYQLKASADRRNS